MVQTDVRGPAGCIRELQTDWHYLTAKTLLTRLVRRPVERLHGDMPCDRENEAGAPCPATVASLLCGTGFENKRHGSWKSASRIRTDRGKSY